jgi:hypothetical protein
MKRGDKVLTPLRLKTLAASRGEATRSGPRVFNALIEYVIRIMWKLQRKRNRWKPGEHTEPLDPARGRLLVERDLLLTGCPARLAEAGG